MDSVISLYLFVFLFHFFSFESAVLDLDLGCDSLALFDCVAKVSCILSYRGIQLILAYSWARPAILVAGKGRG